MKAKLDVLIYNFTKERIPSKKFFLNKLSEFLCTLKENKSVEISLIFVSPSQMKKLNYYWRNKNEVTTVLSFPSFIGDYFADKDQQKTIFSIKDLGEIIFCPKKIKQEAKRSSIKEKDLYLQLLAHGFLHLYGFSHSTKIDSQKMIKFEKLLLENKFAFND